MNENTMHLKVPSRSMNERFARTVCAAFVLPLDPTVEELSEIKTAISEAVTNAIIHGYNGEDGGIPDIDMARTPLYTGKPQSERSGMGFSIMEAFTDELTVESKLSEGTTVTMTKRLGDNADQC